MTMPGCHDGFSNVIHKLVHRVTQLRLEFRLAFDDRSRAPHKVVVERKSISIGGVIAFKGSNLLSRLPLLKPIIRLVLWVNHDILVDAWLDVRRNRANRLLQDLAIVRVHDCLT